MNSRPPAIPAATLVILRDAPGAPELLMVERARTMAFAGGALVFPGGRVDPGDIALADAAQPAEDEARDERACRIAAIRETVEEAGVAIGLSPPPPPAALAAIRRALSSGTSFADALAAAGTTLDLAALTPFARWRPDHAPARVFDAHFYLARLPTGAPVGSVDATENVALLWSTAAAVLAEADAGRARLIFPTRRNLERLAQFACIDAAFADAHAHPVVTITPHVEDRGGVAHLCIPEGLGYPVTSEAMASALRG